MADAPAFDCLACNLPLILVRSAQSPVGYYRCPRCDRQFATPYEAALRAAARPHPSDAAREAGERHERELREVRERLERFLARAEGADPFLTLSLRPTATLAEARERFHDLAMCHHPDRGGDAEAMRRIIEAYDAVRDRLARAARTEARPPPPPKAAVAMVRRGPASWSRARAQAATREDSAR